MKKNISIPGLTKNQRLKELEKIDRYKMIKIKNLD